MSLRDRILGLILTDDEYVADDLLLKFKDNPEVNEFLIYLCGFSLITLANNPTLGKREEI